MLSLACRQFALLIAPLVLEFLQVSHKPCACRRTREMPEAIWPEEEKNPQRRAVLWGHITPYGFLENFLAT